MPAIAVALFGLAASAQPAPPPRPDEPTTTPTEDAAAAAPAAATPASAGTPATSSDAPADEAAIRAALAADRAAQGPAPPPAAATPAAAAVRAPSTAVLNPDLSVILDGTFGYYGVHRADFQDTGLPVAGDDPSAVDEGFGMQEVEFAAQAPVDPYLEAALFLTIPNLGGLEVEEAYLLTTALPGNFQIKAGSFRSQLGRNNGQHLHVQHFTRRPLMTALLFGADGLRGPGAQVSWLAPGLPWFATLYVEAFSIGAPEDGVIATFGGGPRGPRSLTTTATLEQFWEAGDAVSILLGLDAATGIASTCALPPCEGGPRDFLYGADLFLKWRPAGAWGESTSLSWASEWFARQIREGGQREGALYSEAVLQFSKRLYAGVRFDMTGLPAGDAVPRRTGEAASLTFAPTEFSRIRLYGQRLDGPGLDPALIAFLQVEVSMGAHGAHPF